MTDNNILNYKAPEAKVVELMLRQELLVISDGIPTSTETDPEEDLY